MPAVDATLRTAPVPRPTIAGMNAELSATGASTRTRTCWSSRSGSDSANGPPVAKPALLISTDTCSPTDSIRPGSRCRDVALDRSQPSPTARTPNSSVSSAASSSSNGLRRATSTSESPRRASSRAISAPIPPDAPVTSAAVSGVGSGRLIPVARRAYRLLVDSSPRTGGNRPGRRIADITSTYVDADEHANRVPARRRRDGPDLGGRRPQPQFPEDDPDRDPVPRSGKPDARDA